MSNLFNPFNGFRPFGVNDADIFFGRNEQIEELKKKVDRVNFIALVGNSGSGKSSLVRAGLIPLLGKLGSWRVGIFRPEKTPIENLIKVLNHHSVLGNCIDTEYTKINLDYSSAGIVETLRFSSFKGKLLLVVDQFEEIFRFDTKDRSAIVNRDEAIKFINLLVTAVTQPDSQVYVLITLRSDFLGHCAEFKGLAELINDGQFLVPRLTRSQYKEAITGPLKLQGINISPGLISILLNDIGNDPDQLPVLQHALMMTFKEWMLEQDPTIVIDMQHYNAAGGMTQGLGRHLNSIYNDLEIRGLADTVKTTFQRLTDVTEEGNHIRRATEMNELVAINMGKDTTVIEVIDAFRGEGKNFLLPGIEQPILKYTVIDIAHECIMRKWVHLGGWMKEEREDRRMLMQLLDHYESSRKNGGLLRNPMLSTFLNWPKYKAFKHGSIEKLNVLNWADRYTDSLEEIINFLDKSKYRLLLEKTILIVGSFLFFLTLAFNTVQKKIDEVEKVKDSVQHTARLVQDSLNIIKIQAKVWYLDSIMKKNSLLDNVNDSLFSLLKLSKDPNSIDSLRNQIKDLQAKSKQLKNSADEKNALADKVKKLEVEINSKEQEIYAEQFLRNNLLTIQLLKKPELVTSIKEDYSRLVNSNAMDPSIKVSLDKYLLKIDSIKGTIFGNFDKDFRVYLLIRAIDKIKIDEFSELLHREGFSGKIERSVKKLLFDRDNTYCIISTNFDFQERLKEVIEKKYLVTKKTKLPLYANSKPVNFEFKPYEMAAYVVIDLK